jgi:hypothetical protein
MKTSKNKYDEYAVVNKIPFTRRLFAIVIGILSGVSPTLEKKKIVRNVSPFDLF